MDVTINSNGTLSDEDGYDYKKVTGNHVYGWTEVGTKNSGTKAKLEIAIFTNNKVKWAKYKHEEGVMVKDGSPATDSIAEYPCTISGNTATITVEEGGQTGTEVLTLGNTFEIDEKTFKKLY